MVDKLEAICDALPLAWNGDFTLYDWPCLGCGGRWDQVRMSGAESQPRSAFGPSHPPTQ